MFICCLFALWYLSLFVISHLPFFVCLLITFFVCQFITLFVWLFVDIFLGEISDVQYLFTSTEKLWSPSMMPPRMNMLPPTWVQHQHRTSGKTKNAIWNSRYNDCRLRICLPWLLVLSECINNANTNVNINNTNNNLIKSGWWNLVNKFHLAGQITTSKPDWTKPTTAEAASSLGAAIREWVDQAPVLMLYAMQSSLIIVM